MWHGFGGEAPRMNKYNLSSKTDGQGTDNVAVALQRQDHFCDHM